MDHKINGNNLSGIWNDFLYIFWTICIESPQTTQNDFSQGTGFNVDIISDPGNVTLNRQWNRNPSNPVLDVGLPGSWDDDRVFDPNVVFDGAIYRMWFSGYDGSRYRIGYATSPDGITWTKHPGNPVLDLGSPGSWDDYNTHANSVIFDGVTYHMWYSGQPDGTKGRIGYATSPDGISWTKYAGNLCLGTSGNGCVFDTGTSGAWDDTYVYSPDVVYDGITYHMWYTGCEFDVYKIGYATSPDGITWTRNPSNPVLDKGPVGSFEEVKVLYPSVLYNGSAYHMWYTGNNATNSSIGHATSIDGATWIKNASNPVFNNGDSGSWDDAGIGWVDIHSNATSLRMWYTGFDGSKGRIGFAEFGYPSNGYLSSSIFDSGIEGTFWNSMNWIEYLPSNTDITISTRTGNTPTPDPLWSPWSVEMWDETGSSIASPRARYIQYRATLSTNDKNIKPVLCEININYTLNTAQPPVLTSPQDDVWILDSTPTFTWTFGDSEGDLQSGFTVLIDDDPLFMSIDYSSGNIDSSNEWWTPSSPIADGIWYWRVRTRDSGMLWSSYTNYWTLKIDSSPPIFADLTEIPDPQEIFGFVNISVNVTDNVVVSQVWINISGIGSYMMEFDPIQGKYFYNSSYGNLGSYSFTIWSNDTIGNWAFITGSFLMQDTTPPTISNLLEQPDPQEVYGFVNISADVADNLVVSQVLINVSGIGNYTMDFDPIGNKYFRNSSFGTLGTYSYVIWSNDTSNNWASETGSFIIQDETPPSISNIQEDPNPQEVHGFVNVSSKIADNYMIDEVWINIVGSGNFSMIYDVANDRYFYRAQYSQRDTYSYVIWANDTSNNWALASSSFLIQDTTPPDIAGLNEEPDPQFVEKNVRISAIITDNVEVEDVWISINGIGNFTMTFNSSANMFTYEISHQNAGLYSYTIWAKDSSDNWNSISSSYSINKAKVDHDFLEDWWWLILLLIIFLLIIVILLLLLGRRRKEEEDRHAQSSKDPSQPNVQTRSLQQETPRMTEQQSRREVPPPPPP
jgi:predicted GH43/DUF377 family glycosyl hydrolase